MPYLGREPGKSNDVTGNLKVSGTISAESINDKMALNGSDASSPQANANDHFIFEDGGTDGSGTNAGDNLLLEDITPSQAEISLSSIAAGGTSGQLLQSQGSLTAPSFATITIPAGSPNGHSDALGTPDTVQTFTSSGTFTKPDSASLILVEVWGAGGSGGFKATAESGGGGGGGYYYNYYDLVDFGSTETVTIGAGGAAKTPETNGDAGGNTTMTISGPSGYDITAYGG